MAHGSHSAARNATRSGIGRIVRARDAGVAAAGVAAGATKPVHVAGPTGYHAARMDPVRVPSIPAASFPLPPRLEGLRRLAYNLHWAWHPRTRGLFGA